MADNGRPKSVPATPEVVTSPIAADLIVGELQEWRTRLDRESHEQNTTLLVKRRLRALDSTIRQFAALHGLEA